MSDGNENYAVPPDEPDPFDSGELTEANCGVCAKPVSEAVRVDVLLEDNSHDWRHPTCHGG